MKRNPQKVRFESMLAFGVQVTGEMVEALCRRGDVDEDVDVDESRDLDQVGDVVSVAARRNLGPT